MVEVFTGVGVDRLVGSAVQLGISDGVAEQATGIAVTSPGRAHQDRFGDGLLVDAGQCGLRARIGIDAGSGDVDRQDVHPLTIPASTTFRSLTVTLDTMTSARQVAR